jgi:hypothetical protein
MKINPLFNGGGCVCINSVKFSTQQVPNERFHSDFDPTKNRACRGGRRAVVVVVGNAP